MFIIPKNFLNNTAKLFTVLHVTEYLTYTKFCNPCYFIVAMVNFEEMTYSVNESTQFVQPALILSNPSSFAITVQVIDSGNSATSE